MIWKMRLFVELLIFHQPKSLSFFLAIDVRIPSTKMIGAFLNFGRLTGADPCDCDPPIIQFSKQFTFDTFEWLEEYADPGHEISIAKMDAITSMVKYSLLLFF